MTLRGRARQAVSAIRSLRGVTVGRKHFALPVGATFIIEEPWMGDVLRRLLPCFDGDFIDIGANIGQTLLQLRAIDTERRYVGFEPNPSCASYLVELTRLNRFAATELVPVACGKEYGIRRLYFYQDSSSDASASLVSDFRPHQKVTHSAYVITAPINECLAALEVESIGVIKIDIEGFEGVVVESLAREIEKYRPGLILEVLPVYTPENVARVANNRKIEDIAKAYDYSICRIQKTADGRLGRFSPISEFGINDDMTMVDYVLLPSEAISRVLPNGV